ncbi:MAG: adenosylcobalamin-dependent ribonucleoside-diphosphate reductase [Deltaproteobacteria bacterium]|nr:adenosylcobalamin-dependent ribonucleoside-diphosphate reductase [Deltaproteobacteria bacterium]
MAYPELSPQALELLRLRYLRRGPDGEPAEDPEGFFRRVAVAVAAAERIFGGDPAPKAEAYYDLLRSLRFLPNTPALMNAGTGVGQLAACFVLPLEDSTESIYDSLKQMALIHKSGGGTGFSFSRIRPEGDLVASTGGRASGPLSFLELFDTSTWVIRQGGRRRGANMAVLRVDHPDVLAFCRAKLHGRFQNFNFSVGYTDDFDRAVERGGEFTLINPRTGGPWRRLAARDVFEALVEGAWGTGDPGAVFLDAVNRANPCPQLGDLEATNPCGEQPLLPHESCTLGSLNLAVFVRGAELDWDALADAARLGVEFLDDCLEVSVPPAEEIRLANRRTRKIGLGVMGFADCLVALGVPYASEAARGLGRQIMERIEAAGVDASRRLGERRGSFEAFAGSAWERRGLSAMRNATVTTVAPTGSISILAGVSGSIEPLFGLAYTRRIQGEVVSFGTHRMLPSAFEAHGLSWPAWEEAIRREGRMGHLTQLPAALRRLFATTFEIAPADHLAVQAVFQERTHNAVSKTINLPADFPRDALGRVFREAHALGLKGVTVYRYGSVPEQPLEVGDHCNRCAPAA